MITSKKRTLIISAAAMVAACAGLIAVAAPAPQQQGYQTMSIDNLL